MPSSISETLDSRMSVGKRLRACDRSRIATHGKLTEVGLKMFLENGFTATTAAKIAKEAGVSIGTFYIHFKDKEALLSEAWQEYFDEEVGRLLPVANPEDEIRPELIVQRVRANADVLLRWVEERPQEFLFWSGPEVATTAVRREIEAAWVTWVGGRMQMERAFGNELVDGVTVEVATQALMGICNRVLRWWLLNQTRDGREAVLSTLTRLHYSLYSVSSR